MTRNRLYRCILWRLHDTIPANTDRYFAAAISHAGISDHTSYWGKDIGDIRTVKFPWRIVIRGAILIFL